MSLAGLDDRPKERSAVAGEARDPPRPQVRSSNWQDAHPEGQGTSGKCGFDSRPHCSVRIRTRRKLALRPGSLARGNTLALSLKVPVSTLIANAEAQRSIILTDHAKATATYDDALVTATRRLVKELRKKADAIDAGRAGELESDSNYMGRGRGYVNSVQVSVSSPCPPRPDEQPDTSRIDRDLRLLRATSQDAIAVRVDSDLARYL